MPARVDAVGEQRPRQPAPEVDPQACSGEAGMSDGVPRTGIAARPAVEPRFPSDRPVAGNACADRGKHRCRRPRPVEKPGGKLEDAANGAEKPGMPGAAAQCKTVFVMDFALQHPPPPAAMFSGDRWPGRWPPAQPRRQALRIERATRQAFDRNAEEQEVDVRIDRRAGAPGALQDEGPQAIRIVPIGVDRFDGGQMGAMRQAIPERQPAFGGAGNVVLTQIGNGVGKRLVEIDPAFVGQPQDHRRRRDDLGQRCEVEPMVDRQRLEFGLALGKARNARRPPAVGAHDPQGRAGDTRRGNGGGSGGKAPVGDVIDHASVTGQRSRLPFSAVARGPRHGTRGPADRNRCC